MDLFGRLSRDHENFVHYLTELNDVIEAIRHNGRGDLFVEEMDRLVPLLTDDIAVHSKLEEVVLFPKVRNRLPDDGPIPVLLEEHRAITAFYEKMRDSYGLWRDGQDLHFSQWAEAGQSLRGTFSVHMQKENLIFFPLARRVLTLEDLSDIERANVLPLTSSSE